MSHNIRRHFPPIGQNGREISNWMKKKSAFYKYVLYTGSDCVLIHLIIRIRRTSTAVFDEISMVEMQVNCKSDDNWRQLIANAIRSARSTYAKRGE